MPETPPLYAVIPNRIDGTGEMHVVTRCGIYIMTGLRSELIAWAWRDFRAQDPVWAAALTDWRVHAISWLREHEHDEAIEGEIYCDCGGEHGVDQPAVTVDALVAALQSEIDALRAKRGGHG